MKAILQRNMGSNEALCKINFPFLFVCSEACKKDVVFKVQSDNRKFIFCSKSEIKLRGDLDVIRALDLDDQISEIGFSKSMDQ